MCEDRIKAARIEEITACAGVLNNEADAMREQWEDLITKGTLGPRKMSESLCRDLKIQRRALAEGYAMVADILLKRADSLK